MNCGNRSNDKNSTLQVGDTESSMNLPFNTQANPMVLVSRGALSDLTDQIAFSLNKMRDLEEQVKVIPELQRRLDYVISDTNSNSSLSRNFDNCNGSVMDKVAHIDRGRKSIYNGADIDEPEHKCNLNNSGNNVENNNRIHNTNQSTDQLLKAINPSLQRHYKSFMHSNASGNGSHNSSGTRNVNNVDRLNQRLTNNHSPRADATTITNSDSLASSSDATGDFGRHVSRANSLSSRPTCGRKSDSLDRHMGKQVGYLDNENKQSLNAFRSTQGSSGSGLGCSSGALTSSSKVEYEDLINDLISLSYSVNYLSSNSNTTQSESSGYSQSKETLRHNVLSSFNLSQNPAFSSNSHNSNRNNMILNPSQANTNQLQQHNNCLSNNNHHQSYRPPNNNLIPYAVSSLSRAHTFNSHNQGHMRTSSLSYIPENNNHNHSSIQAVNGPLDCGCLSIREHLKYNTISREQRLNQSKSNPTSANNTTSRATTSSPLQPAVKVDASTNTELSMSEIITKAELKKIVKDERPTRAGSSIPRLASRSRDKSSTEELVASSTTESKSCSTPGTMSDAGDEIRIAPTVIKARRKPVRMETFTIRDSSETDDLDSDDARQNAGSANEEGAISLGSSYQDPSDFEEYCAYNESLDRQTKIMSYSNKIPTDLRFALIRLNDCIRNNGHIDQVPASSNCVEVIRKEWFAVAADKDSQATDTKLYVDYFESFTKQLLNTVVNLTDNAGNTAIHYAASHYKMDVIEVLLNTKVCDVNCRNKAGYTPIMLLALADITEPKDQNIARKLFSMGDVNIQDRTSGQTALMLACSHGRTSTCKLLVECGADPSLRDCDGSTALMCCSEIGNVDIVKILLTHKLTDPTATDNDGLDALAIAMNNNHKNIGVILYAAKNVPRMSRPTNGKGNIGNTYVEASLRRNRGKTPSNYVRRSDSLMGSRNGRPTRHSGA